MSNIKKYAHLVMVTEGNNNKYYIAEYDGVSLHFNVKYGRIGSTEQHHQYPISMWDKKYSEKIKKGYVDQTELFSIKAPAKKFKDIDDVNVAEFIDKLLKFSNKSVSDNYSVSAASVTEQQIKAAQDLLNDIIYIRKTTDNDELNKKLLAYYSVIPRKMSNTNFYLVGKGYNTIDEIISSEQDKLDALSGQVQTNIVQDNVDEEIDILGAFGLSIRNVTDAERVYIISKLQDLGSAYKSAFKVTNKNTQSIFDAEVEVRESKKTEKFWHGSRNENWWSILGTGLMIRPSNAVITGAMFGHGIYAADKAQKSYGYTSGRGSYWARGNSNSAYMGLFEFHTGKPLRIQKHENWCTQLTWDSLRTRGDYDSVFAEGGYDLRNNEYIIYKQNQCTIDFIVELRT